MGSFKDSLVELTAKSSPPIPRTHSFTYERLHRGRQLRRLLGASLARWILTVALCASVYAVLWHYSSKDAMPKRKKKEFNTLILGLSILLSLNLASSLKHLIGTLRWWVLSWLEWTPREADLVLQSDNFSRMIRLLSLSSHYPLRFYIVFWLSMNVAAQIALALLGLTYSVNGADKIVPTVLGTVAITNLTNIQTQKVVTSSAQTSSQALNAARFTANSYGIVALAGGVDNNTVGPAPGSLYNPDLSAVGCDNGTCHSWFWEATPEDLSYYMLVASNRSVSTTSVCQAWKVIQGGIGNQINITVDDGNSTEYTLPLANGPEQTTFLIDPLQDQHVGWSIVSAFEASTVDPWFYRCNVSVGPVINAVIPEHELGDPIKLLAPSAIALQGYGSSAQGTNITDITQFQSYPAESIFGSPCAGDTLSMSSIMSIFSSGVIYAVTQANTNINAPGRLPVQGITLDISHWSYVHVILGLIMGLQLLLAIVSVICANRVMCRDHSHFGEASLLRSAMYDLNYRAIMASEKELASLFPKGTTMRYVPEGNGVYYLRASPG